MGGRTAKVERPQLQQLAVLSGRAPRPDHAAGHADQFRQHVERLQLRRPRFDVAASARLRAEPARDGVDLDEGLGGRREKVLLLLIEDPLQGLLEDARRRALEGVLELLL